MTTRRKESLLSFHVWVPEIKLSSTGLVACACYLTSHRVPNESSCCAPPPFQINLTIFMWMGVLPVCQSVYQV